MRTLFLTCFVVLVVVIAARPENMNDQGVSAPTQTEPSGSPMPPQEVVAELWNMATRGDLLDTAGQRDAASFFAKPLQLNSTDSSDLQIISNRWGPPRATSISENNAQVAVGYLPEGQIDAQLRYIPPQETKAQKFGIVYTMILTQSYSTVTGYARVPGGFERDWKLDKSVAGPKVWRIEAPQFPPLPFATVNTAIRYVLEKRDETKDPTLRKNADLTLVELLKLH